ncbi:MAG: SMP-30/gluconolactonase/LRE family protein [Planctomycetota bacterium]
MSRLDQPKPHRLPVEPSKLAEGPVWHDDALWWTDIEGRRLHRLGGDALDQHTSWAMPVRVGALLPSAGPAWLLACEDGLHRWTPGGERVLLADPDADRPEMRFNDAKTAPDGHVLAGTLALTEPKAGRGCLYRWDGASVEPVVEGVTVSNGLGWSQDGGTLWYVDTPTGRVDAFDYADGRVANRRPVVTDFPGKPDGLCVTADDTLLVAQWAGSCVVHCDPATGEHLGRIDFDTPNVTSVCFGGDAWDRLFVTTASGGVFEVTGSGLAGRAPTLIDPRRLEPADDRPTSA